MSAPLVPVMMLKTGEMDGVTYLAGVEYPLDEDTAYRLMRTVPSFRNEDEDRSLDSQSEGSGAFTIEQGVDGTDETFDIVSPTGKHLASVPYWDDREKAETVAGRVADLFNAIYLSTPYSG